MKPAVDSSSPPSLSSPDSVPTKDVPLPISQVSESDFLSGQKISYLDLHGHEATAQYRDLRSYGIHYMNVRCSPSSAASMSVVQSYLCGDRDARMFYRNLPKTEESVCKPAI